MSESLELDSRSPEDVQRATRACLPPLGLSALAISILGFLLAAASPWAAPAFEPERPSLDDVAVDLVVGFKEKLEAKLKNEPPPLEAKPAPVPTNWYRACAVLAGALGVCLGTTGFVRREDSRLNLSAVVLGLVAMLIQFFLMFAVILLAVLLIGVILNALGIGLVGLG